MLNYWPCLKTERDLLKSKLLHTCYSLQTLTIQLICSSRMPIDGAYFPLCLGVVKRTQGKTAIQCKFNHRHMVWESGCHAPTMHCIGKA